MTHRFLDEADLELYVKGKLLDHRVEFGVSGFDLRIELGGFLLQSFQAGFLVVELLRVALKQRFLFRSSF